VQRSKTPPKGSAAFLAAELAHGSYPLRKAMEFNGATTLCHLLGVKDSEAVVTAAQQATEGRAQVLALAFTLAALEASLDTACWQHPERHTGRYFAFLAANGYTLSDVEKLCLPKPKPSAGSGRTTKAAATVTELPAAGDAGTPGPAEELAGEPEPAA
jgi:hypothetical protein